jgi:hypothetical protein
MAIRRALIRYYRYYLFTIRLLLEHYLKLQRTKIATPRKIIVPKNLDFTDPVYRKKLRLPLAKLRRLRAPFWPQAEFAAFVVESTEKWAKVIQAAGIKVE